MPIDLRDKPIAITGGGTGIGLWTAIECARAGMPVAISGRREDKLREAADLIRREAAATAARGSPPARVLTMPLDVTDARACEAFVARAIAEFGSLYAVLANAGYGVERSVLRADDAMLRDMFETNFWGSLNVVRPAAAHMLSRPRPGGVGAGDPPPRGHVLFTSSCLAKIGVPFYACYCATKAAQDYFGRAMRLELEPAGVKVSTVHPIGTKTEFFDKAGERSGPGGTKLVNATDERFMQHPRVVARAIVRCLQRPRGEVWTSTPMRLALGACVMFPSIADALLRVRLAGKVRSDPTLLER
jgi:NAD(P)-dependent dehydrogenase (short-subunit alcohol dehydrogenase family)